MAHNSYIFKSPEYGDTKLLEKHELERLRGIDCIVNGVLLP